MKIEKKRKQKLIPIAATFAVVAAGSLAYFYFYSQNTPSQDDSTKSGLQQPDDAKKDQNLDPGVPKDEDKDRVVDQGNVTPESPKRKVSVFVTDASQYGDIVEVRAYVNEIASKGTCELVFTKGSQSLKRTATLLPAASTTSCKTATIPISAFPQKGSWSLTITYASNSATGVSEKRTVTIE